MRALFALLVLALSITSHASARCRPAVGYGLVRVGSGPIAPGSTLVVRLEPVYAEAQAADLPLARVTARDARRRVTVLPTRSLAANLWAIEVPRRAGRYSIWPGGFAVEVDASATATAAPTAAPALAAAPIGRTRIGTGTFAPTIELGAAVPAEAVGVLLSWDEGSWFVPAGETMIGPGRCTPDVPGYDPIDPGDVVTARFVGASGDLSPEASFTAAEPD